MRKKGIYTSITRVYNKSCSVYTQLICFFAPSGLQTRVSWVYLLGFIALCAFFLLLSKILLPRIGSFGCFDDCFNYVAGYFLGKGKRLYSEIFFNHQMLLAYVSYGVQHIFSPQTIYELIRRHREALLAWGLVMNVLLLYRFGVASLGFTVVYELSKYYVFGDRFLAESFVVYPLVYCAGVVLKSIFGEPVRWYDMVFSSIFTWFVVFSREPFIPLSIFLFGYILWSNKSVRLRNVSILLFLILSSSTLFPHLYDDYFFQVVDVNRRTTIKPDQMNIIATSFYPVTLFFGGDWNVFRGLEIVHSVVFLVVSLYFAMKKMYKLVFILFFLLALANFRSVEPGKVFYEAFHLIPWWGMFVFFTWQLVWRSGRKVLFIPLSIITVLFLVNPSNYIYDAVDRHKEFTTNYANEYVHGEVVRLLADPEDTLFLDGWDDLIYWQSGKVSPYKYSWYTSSMPYFSQFTDARRTMFLTNPPDFYYGSCEKNTTDAHTMPDEVRRSYKQFLFSGKPTCLYVYITTLSKIPQERFQTIEPYNFSIEQ